MRLPYGGWWLGLNDSCNEAINLNNFEKREWLFVANFLREGMIAIDVGAHHGFYTVLASRKVGISGRVFSFEPSPREQRWLNINLRVNRCKNVKIEPVALASEDGEATLFLGDWSHTLFNSLRPPAISGPVEEINVRTMRLDKYVEREGIKHIDFIKIDAEGGELQILKGADGLFKKISHPVIMAEVSEKRTKAWGYPSSEINDFLTSRGYRWFALNLEGKMVPFEDKEKIWNFIAVPEERLGEIKGLIESL